MANFTAKLRKDYRDMSGLVLDLRPEDLFSIEGEHDGGMSALFLSDSSADWIPDSLIGKTLINTTNDDVGHILSNTATTVIAINYGDEPLVWDAGMTYAIQADASGMLRWPNRAPVARIAGRAGYSGEHDAGVRSSLVVSSKPWSGFENRLIGLAVYNLTDGSSGFITSNSADTVYAMLSGGAFDRWDTGDQYVIAAPRFGDAVSPIYYRQPAIRRIDGMWCAQFRGFKNGYFDIEAGSALVPYPRTWWTMAIEKWNEAGGGASKQALFSLNNSVDFETGLSWWRRHLTVHKVYHGYEINGAAEQDDGLWVAQSVSGGNPFLIWKDGVVDATMSGSANQPLINTIIDGIIGSLGSFYDVEGGAAHRFGFDGCIRSMRVWDRNFSPLEIDFIHRSLASDGADYSANDRAALELRIWTDEAGDWQRITRQSAASQRFSIATIDGKARLQVAAEVGSRVLPDSELGGDEFEMAFVEHAGSAPAVIKETGWSSIADLVIDSDYPGHYALMVSRENGGSVIIHFDVEAA
jgi:hypothetical protein